MRLLKAALVTIAWTRSETDVMLETTCANANAYGQSGSQDASGGSFFGGAPKTVPRRPLGENFASWEPIAFCISSDSLLLWFRYTDGEEFDAVRKERNLSSPTCINISTDFRATAVCNRAAA